MLVLTRKPGETIVIDDGTIEVKILEVKGNQIKIGVKAPKNIPVHREEIQARIDNERKS